MKTFFTSDLHFGHKNIIGYCNRPFGSVEHMDQALIDNWNMCVGHSDLVYVLGDVSFHGPEHTEDLLMQLKGNKILIAGNHERDTRARKVPWTKYFQEIHDYRRVSIDGHKFVLCHFPFAAWERGYINLHGHTHGQYQGKHMQHDVGVDSNNYAPLLLADAVKRATEEGKDRPLY